MSEDRRKVRCHGEELGEISVDKLYRMAMRGEIDYTAEFWSFQRKQWAPLAGIIFDLFPDRIDEMRRAGIVTIEVFGSGEPDCPACSELQGKLFSVNDAPALPPVNCTCQPWCRCIFLAKK